MATRISKTFTFEAAHRLQYHGGHCRRLHGHSYQVTISITGALTPSGSEEGMVLDFGRLSEAWAPIKERLDHRTILQHTDPLIQALGDDVTITPFAPTAENLAEFIWGRMNYIHDHLQVTVNETATSSATYPA